MDEQVKLTRDCNAVQIPAGHPVSLPKGTVAIITQSLGGTYTIQVPTLGGLFRVAGKDGDALGKNAMAISTPAASASAGDLESAVWEQLRTCYDPEIPVNIVDLGLVYELQVATLPSGQNRVQVKMTLTAPGCGMGTAIAYDARSKILELPHVEEADVQLVWDPPWSPQMISPEGRALLGMD